MQIKEWIKKNRQLFVAIVSSVLLVPLVIWVMTLGDNIQSLDSVTKSSTSITLTASHTPTILASLTPSPVKPTIQVVFTNTSVPSPVFGPVGTNLPQEFIVAGWHDNRATCNPNFNYDKVEITGVDIYGGTPPYYFTFSKDGEIIAIRIVNMNGEVTFSKPVSVERGSYIHVDVTFDLEDEKVFWIDDLKYPYKDTGCKND